MNLVASRYMSREDCKHTDLRINGEQIDVINNADDEEAFFETGDLIELRFRAGYWRKANAIHRWFVNHVQNGLDDCRQYLVSDKQLEELLRTVNAVLNVSKLVDGKVKNGEKNENGKWVPILEDGKVIADPTLAKELLPTQEGFFFGSTEYDHYYVDDLKLTKSILGKALEKPELEYYYSSWW